MRSLGWLLLAVFCCTTAFSQDGFHFDKPGRKKVTIPFALINNLAIVTLKVNGTEMNFLLDTGVDETILFSLDDQNKLSLNNIEKIKLRGLGANDAVEGLKSSHNKMAFPGYTDDDHEIYIVLDQNFNFSASIGIPVNGILGYDFFKNNLVELNYDRRKIVVHNRENVGIQKKLTKQFKAADIVVEGHKPYITADVSIHGDNFFPAKLLMDSGNTDAVWLFPSKSDKITLPERRFDDFLGRGLSGDVMGCRGRIEKFTFNGNEFSNSIGAFPDASSINNITLATARVGSVGAEIMRRFTIIFDYRDQKIHLRRSNHYHQPFSYNMSGLEVHHEGMSWVQEKVSVETSRTSSAQKEVVIAPRDFTYKFELKPIFSIANVRKDSPADACGVKKGDILLRINGILCYRLSLQEINTLLKSEEGKTIELEVERMGKPIKFLFKLKSII